jgi:SNW domain-containing protein 1
MDRIRHCWSLSNGIFYFFLYLLCRQNRRFVPDKEFSGTERGGGMSRSGPVQFEKEELDPFGLDAFLDTAKRASKRNNEEDRRKEDRYR